MMLSVINPLPVELESADVRRSPGKCSTIALFAGHLRDGDPALCASFDYLVGQGEQRLRKPEVQPSRGLKLEDELIVSRRLRRQHGRLFAAAHAANGPRMPRPAMKSHRLIQSPRRRGRAMLPAR